MPNQNHLHQLLQGVEAWNSWRAEKPQFTPDLRGANLERVQLEGINLAGANLRGANLRGANLERARLDQAMLLGADLEKAQLDSAYGIHNEIISDKRERGLHEHFQ